MRVRKLPSVTGRRTSCVFPLSIREESFLCKDIDIQTQHKQRYGQISTFRRIKSITLLIITVSPRGGSPPLERNSSLRSNSSE